jgi:tripartite-type tricarboxylate transporter receptor subunit TctC
MIRQRRRLLAAGGLGLVSGGLPGVSLAQAYPSRPIRVIVPFGPGGVTDVLARLLSAEIAKDFGQPVVVENMPGGTGLIGTGAVAKAVPDGHTILFTSNAHTINPALRKQMPFDSVKDFTPLVLLAAAPNMLVVRSDSAIRSVAEYIAAAKAKPGEINYATSGVGTSLHIAGEQFSQITGAKFNHVPYAASNQSVQAVLGGHVVSSWSAVNAALPFVKAGRMRPLAVASEKRTEFAPDVPTFAEVGIKGMKSETWLAALGPAGLPAPVAAKLAAELQMLIARADVKQKILGLGAEPVGVELEAFRAQIRDEIEMYTKIARAGDIKAE